MNIPAIVWLTALVAFGVIEASTAALVSVWFMGGALGAMIAALLGASIGIQLAVFAVVSAALLAGLRPFVQKYLKPRTVPTNVDSLIGRTAVVVEEIDNLHATGTVRIDSVLWMARSAQDQTIPVGATVRVERIEGVKVFVSPAEMTAGGKEEKKLCK